MSSRRDGQISISDLLPPRQVQSCGKSKILSLRTCHARAGVRKWATGRMDIAFVPALHDSMRHRSNGSQLTRKEAGRKEAKLPCSDVVAAHARLDDTVGEGLKSTPIWADPHFGQALGANAASGALLGPLLDNYHSAFGALRYANPIELPGVTTSWWTPPLFALAGIIIGNGVLLADNYLQPSSSCRFPTVPTVLYTISAFCSLYYLSGLFHASGLENDTNLVSMTVLAGLVWLTFDRSIAGLVLGFATAIGGPLIEIGIINLTGAYCYSAPDMWGVPFWIVPVYFAGAPAVGNLSRLYYNWFTSSSNVE